MLRTKQYVKLGKKYHTYKLYQSDNAWYVYWKAFNKLFELLNMKEWRRYCEKTQFIKY